MMLERPATPSRTFFLLLALCALAWLPISAAGAPAGTSAAEEASSRLEIQEIRLENGLRIFVLERPSTPTFAAIYQFGVGGASDPKGRSGIAHLLEHMMFKGTGSVGITDPGKEAALLARLDDLWTRLHAELDREADPFAEADAEAIAALRAEIEEVNAEHKKLIVKNEYDELMTRAGGVGLNASTGQDVTRYYIQLPSNRLEFWFRMEGDRLRNPVFREFYSERDVVIEERRQRYDNTPWGRSYEAMLSLLFVAHPYGNPVIGWPSDLQRLMRRDAMDYFTTYYSPSNCVMALVGDVKTAEVRRLAEKYLGGWQRQELPRLPITDEPEQQGERRRIVEFDAEPQLQVAWRTVEEGHPDQYALDVLSMVLGGLYSSRFDETIVQKDRLASRAGTGHPTYRYGGYFSASGTVRADHGTEELEAAFEREIRRIQEDGVTAEEVERAKTAVEASRVRGLKSNMGQAMRIANAVFTSGGIAYMDDYERRIEAVTPEQVRDVAVRYLKPQRKNVVVLRTVESEDAGGSGGGSGVTHQRGGAPGPRGRTHSKGFDAGMKMLREAKPVELRVPELGKEVRRVELDGGVTVFIKEDRSAPSVEMGFVWLGGSNTAPVEDLARFELASDLLNEGGTADLTPAELQAKLDELGMSFGLWIGSTTSGGRFWSLRRNFEESFDLALDVLMEPRLDPERLEVLKGQYIERMRRRDESPGRAASILLNRTIFKDHPRLGYTPARAEIQSLTPEQIREVWTRYLGRDNLFLTVVGDFDADEMLELLREKLGNWRKAKQTERRYITHEPFLRPGVFLVEQELPQPAIRLYHQIGVDREAPKEDHAALEILNDILGGSGFRSRLMERLRSDEGLTYGIYSGISHQGRKGVPGALRISYQTRKDSVLRSIDSVLEEVRGVIVEKVNAAEVAEQVEAWRNRFVFRYTNDFYTVARLMYNEIDDRPYDYDRIELDAVQKVTVDDVHRVARKYLAPENLTVAIYGALTPEDRAALDERFELTVLDKAEVFVGGYDAPAEAAAETPQPVE